MSKTSFSKGQLILISNILKSEKLIPCDKIGIYTDVINSEYRNVYSIIKVVKGKKQLDIGFITRTYPKNFKLQEQLYQYFGKNMAIINKLGGEE